MTLPDTISTPHGEYKPTPTRASSPEYLHLYTNGMRIVSIRAYPHSVDDWGWSFGFMSPSEIIEFMVAWQQTQETDA